MDGWMGVKLVELLLVQFKKRENLGTCITHLFQGSMFVTYN
jgi:hypothetical protein